MLNLKTLRRLEATGLVDFVEDPTITDADVRERKKICNAQESVFWQLTAGHFCDFLENPSPPKPLQYVHTGVIRHPRRPLPPRSPEPFYLRHIQTGAINSLFTLRPCLEIDVENLFKWMNEPRVSAFWGEEGNREHQLKFIQNGLKSKHSFPVIGSWEDIDERGISLGIKDACYFEIYWVKEDHLASYVDGVDDYDRGVHVLVGEDWAKGRFMAWMSCLIHCMLDKTLYEHWLIEYVVMFLDDPRTKCVYLEPRVDNKRYFQFSVCLCTV